MTEKNSIRGKKSRAAGARFELKIRGELEGMGWIVDKWTNTVDYDRDGNIGKVVPAKRKFNPFKKMLVVGTGFPDFIAFKKIGGKKYEVIGIEVKARGYLDKIEKGMCHWLLDNKIFSKILIAKKGKKRGEIVYDDFKKKYS
ncbi:MAG: hypothetical protein KKB31_00890 [Nanoarchaeota archaeon]|nr:hypothetical protein [Nanoarchaeota archaeon]